MARYGRMRCLDKTSLTDAASMLWWPEIMSKISLARHGGTIQISKERSKKGGTKQG